MNTLDEAAMTLCETIRHANKPEEVFEVLNQATALYAGYKLKNAGAKETNAFLKEYNNKLERRALHYKTLSKGGLYTTKHSKGRPWLRARF